MVKRASPVQSSAGFDGERSRLHAAEAGADGAWLGAGQARSEIESEVAAAVTLEDTEAAVEWAIATGSQAVLEEALRGAALGSRAAPR